MTIEQAKMLSPLSLAFVGDAVYTLYARSKVIQHSDAKIGALHTEATKLVKASGQAEMADAIAFDMKRGVTVIPAKGWYSKEEKEVLMVVTRKTDLNLLLRYVKCIDPDAFLSVSSVMGVYGQGFDTIKVKTKK